MAEERLQKILSRAGVASRRKAEQLITAGRVTVNGEIMSELGSKADLDRDHIKVDGKLLHAPGQLVYLALNKPRGVVTTVSDPEGRQTVMDLVRGVKARVYPVGRLDYASEGLLLLTNDGELANRLTAARSHVQKVYVVKTNGPL
ncbi:MAG TPA: pseudouridine synthase, partial [Bryobacteraceae bacterium]|nr:pseudouridine synthase [Bryobacteraceae bacterium]